MPALRASPPLGWGLLGVCLVLKGASSEPCSLGPVATFAVRNASGFIFFTRFKLLSVSISADPIISANEQKGGQQQAVSSPWRLFVYAKAVPQTRSVCCQRFSSPTPRRCHSPGFSEVFLGAGDSCFRSRSPHPPSKGRLLLEDQTQLFSRGLFSG